MQSNEHEVQQDNLIVSLNTDLYNMKRALLEMSAECTALRLRLAQFTALAAMPLDAVPVNPYNGKAMAVRNAK